MAMAATPARENADVAVKTDGGDDRIVSGIVVHTS